MAAKLGGSDNGVIVDINITPFVDIVLVILIIDEHLQWYLDGEPTSAPALRAVLSEHVARAEAGGGEVVCLVSADTVVPHGEVIRLVDLVKSEGVSRFALDVDPAKIALEEDGDPTPEEPGEPGP